MENPTENASKPDERAGCAVADLFGVWVPTDERVPENPKDFPNEDHVPCLCIWIGECRGGEIRILQWNAYYKVWDGADGDDFFCEAQKVTHWMPLPPSPNIRAETGPRQDAAPNRPIA